MNKRIILLFIALASNLMHAAAFNQPDAHPSPDVGIMLNNQSTHAILVDSKTSIPSSQRNVALAPKGSTIQDFLSRLNSEKTFRVVPPATPNDVMQHDALMIFTNDFDPSSIIVSFQSFAPPIDSDY